MAGGRSGLRSLTFTITDSAITAEIQSADLVVEPGEPLTAAVRLRNSGPDEARLTVAVTGPARPYSWVAGDVVTLAAASEEIVRIGFRIPRTAQPPAGPLAFEVTATRAGEATPAATAAGAVQVRPFSVLSATLSDPSGDPARYEVALGNRGNGPMPTTLRAEAEGDDLDVRIDPATVVVTPGTRATSTVEVVPRKQARVGDPRSLPFRIVAQPEVGDPVEVRGHYLLRPRFSRTPVLVTAVVASLALIAGAVVLTAGGGDEPDRGRADTGTETDTEVAAGGAPLEQCPARGHVDEFGVRNLSREEIARLPDTYTFMRVKADGCSPVRFNPCEPVHYVQNAGAAPEFALDNIRESFRRLARATGMTFVDDGLADETARSGPIVPERYGQKWAPILIVWEHFPEEQTTGRAQVLGNTVVYREQEVIVSARLRFNVDAYNDEFTKRPIEPGFGPPVGSGDGPIGRQNIQWGRIVLHELAHVVGLGHTRDTGSLMYPDAAQHTSRPADFMRPDLMGLRYLGREAGCVPTPPVPPT